MIFTFLMIRSVYVYTHRYPVHELDGINRSLFPCNKYNFSVSSDRYFHDIFSRSLNSLRLPYKGLKSRLRCMPWKLFNHPKCRNLPITIWIWFTVNIIIRVIRRVRVILLWSGIYSGFERAKAINYGRVIT